MPTNNAEWMMELDNHCLARMIFITNSSKNYQWMLKLWSKTLKWNFGDIYMAPKDLPTEHLLITKGELQRGKY